jgi:hypothetical protein
LCAWEERIGFVALRHDVSAGSSGRIKPPVLLVATRYAAFDAFPGQAGFRWRENGLVRVTFRGNGLG